MPFQHHFDRYEIKDATMTLMRGAVAINDKVRVVTQGYDAIVPLLYSFHCSSFDWYVSARAPNATRTKVTLNGFQVKTIFFLSLKKKFYKVFNQPPKSFPKKDHEVLKGMG